MMGTRPVSEYNSFLPHTSYKSLDEQKEDREDSTPFRYQLGNAILLASPAAGT